MKKITIIPLLLLVLNINAQNIEFGPKIGLNLSNQRWSQGSDESVDAPWSQDGVSRAMIPGFQIGGFANIFFANNLCIRPELLFSQRGQIVNFDESRKDRLQLNYIDIPLNVSYNLAVGEARIDVFAGPYLALALGGNLSSDFEDSSMEDEKRTVKAGKIDLNEFDPSTESYVRPLDVGLKAGLGAKYSNFYFSVNYDLGFLNTNPQLTEYPEGISYSDFQALRNNTLSISIAYCFGNMAE